VTTVLVLYPRSASFRGADFERYEGALNAFGIRLILGDDDAAPSFLRLFETHVVLPRPEEVEDAWDVLRTFLEDSAIPVDAVFAQTESAMALGAIASRHLGVPGTSVEAAYACTNKHVCRGLLASAGVPQPRYGLAASAADALRVVADAGAGFPVVLKGVASACQRLVTRVGDEGELASAFRSVQARLATSLDIRRLESFERVAGIEPSCDPRRELLVEELAPGAPLETDGHVRAGMPCIYGVTEQVHARRPDFFIEGYLLPADRAAEDLARIEAVSDAALRAIGLREGCFSLEIRDDGEQARVIEINGRLGCDEGFGDLFEAVVGLHPALLALQLALGLEPRPVPRPVRAALAYRCHYGEGVVARVPEAAELDELRRDGTRVGVNVRPGERTEAPGHPDIHPHLAYVLELDAHSSRGAYERARAVADGMSFGVSARAGS